MDYDTYKRYILLFTWLPTVIVAIILFILWRRNRDIEEFILLVVMKSIISKNNINKEARLFVCNRILSKQRHFVTISMIIVSSCLQIFFLIAMLEISYECINDPNLDCFKENDRNQSSVNCSSLTQDDFVTCYRITAFDPERTFLGAAAAYLLFKMVNVALFIVAQLMLWVARKWKRKTVRGIKFGFILVLAISFFTTLILSANLNEVRSAARKLPITVYLQASLILTIVAYFTWLPWEKFTESEEYFRDVSLPVPKDVYENEIDQNV